MRMWGKVNFHLEYSLLCYYYILMKKDTRFYIIIYSFHPSNCSYELQDKGRQASNVRIILHLDQNTNCYHAWTQQDKTVPSDCLCSLQQNTLKISCICSSLSLSKSTSLWHTCRVCATTLAVYSKFKSMWCIITQPCGIQQGIRIIFQYRRSAHTVPTRTFQKTSPDTAMLFASFGCTHPPLPVPPFLLT